MKTSLIIIGLALVTFFGQIFDVSAAELSPEKNMKRTVVGVDETEIRKLLTIFPSVSTAVSAKALAEGVQIKKVTNLRVQYVDSYFHGSTTRLCEVGAVAEVVIAGPADFKQSFHVQQLEQAGECPHFNLYQVVK